MTEKTVTQLLSEVNAATNAVAARQQTLLDQIANSNSSAAELTAAKAGLQAEIDKLTALASGSESDPLNP